MREFIESFLTKTERALSSLPLDEIAKALNILQGVFERRDEGWIRTQIQHPRQHNPQTVMPNLGLSNAEVDAILEALRGTN